MLGNNEPITVIIPARYESSRFPGKPLAQLAGKPLVQHVYEGAARASGVTQVLVATDDVRIFRAVESFGGEGRMVEGPFRTGTDRVAEVAKDVTSPVVLNLQADEIILHPSMLDDLMTAFLQSHLEIGTLKRRLENHNDLQQSSIVKVVTNCHNEALYFSRAPIPHQRDPQTEDSKEIIHYMHLGLYIFRRETLLRFAQLPTGELEAVEKLEQLRALENRIPIGAWETTHPSLRIDTPEDLEQARLALERVPSCQS